MGFLGSLFGGKKAPKSTTNALFALVTAQVDLEAQHGLTTTGKAGICFNPMESSFFTNLESEVKSLLAVGEETAGTRYRVLDDGYGFRWVILQDADFEDLVTAAYLTSQSFEEHDFGGRLLAAVFPFTYQGAEVQWIYVFKRGKFYPFIPLPGRQQRDNSMELSLSSKVEKTLPIEKELERWYALWGAPFSALS